MFFTFILIFLIIYNQFLYILEQRWLTLGRNFKITWYVIMSPKLSKFQNFKKNFKDALLKYIVVKLHNVTWSINHTVSNWKWGCWKFVWVYIWNISLPYHTTSGNILSTHFNSCSLKYLFDISYTEMNIIMLMNNTMLG